MRRYELIAKIQERKQQIGISIENIAKLSHSGVRTVHRLLSGEDVKLSTLEKVTNILGLDFAGNVTVPLKELIEKRANEKAIFMASLVQGTSALEMQGLEKDSLDNMIKEFEEAFIRGKYKHRLWVV